MIDGVAQEVGERLEQSLNDAPVGLHPVALDRQLDVLTEAFGHLPNHAREPAQERPDGRHAQGHHPLVRLADQAIDRAVLRRQGICELARLRAGPGHGDHRGQAGLGGYELVDQGGQSLHPPGIHVQGAASGLGRPLGGRARVIDGRRAELGDAHLVHDESVGRLDLDERRREGRVDEQVARKGIVGAVSWRIRSQGQLQMQQSRGLGDNGQRIVAVEIAAGVGLVTQGDPTGRGCLGRQLPAQRNRPVRQGVLQPGGPIIRREGVLRQLGEEALGAVRRVPRQDAGRLKGFQPRLGLVQHRHQAPDDHRIDGPLVVPHGGQDVFGRVQDPRHRRQIEQAHRPLQGVHRSERLVDPGAIVRLALERQEGVGAQVDQVGPLDQELGEQLVHQPASGRW